MAGKYAQQDDRIVELHKEGLSSKQISDQLIRETGEYYAASVIRKRVQKWKKKQEPDVPAFEEALDEAGFAHSSKWSFGWLKTGEVSVFIKNKADIVSFEQMREDFLNEIKGYEPIYYPIKREPIEDGHLLVVDIADLHIGKLASSFHTGDEYNVEIAVQRAIEGVQGILQKASGYDIDQILFVVGNDVLHADGLGKSTTKGTTMDVDGMWYNNYRIARQMYTQIIESLTQVADVHVVHNPSNHDYVSGFMLADALSCWFKNNPNVTFDVSMAKRKYFVYGRNLIGTEHGDGVKLDQYPLTMANEVPNLWAVAPLRYFYLHHIHHKDVFKFRTGKDYQGVTVEYLRSPSGSDGWHHEHGYQGAPQAIEGYIHHKEYGQVSRITHRFK